MPPTGPLGLPIWISLPLIRFVHDATVWWRSDRRHRPDEIRSIRGEPHHATHRIFFPSGFSSSTSTTWPLVIDVHGGGWMIGTPAMDDELCRFVASTCSAVVVSLDYRKAPEHACPAAAEDVVAGVLAAIDDVALRVDPARVVLLGSSAGGNLVLAACLDERLRGKVAALVGLYPSCDVATPRAVKMERRTGPGPDNVAQFYELMLDCYFGEGKVEMDGTVASPINFKSREELPRRVYLTGCEYDMLLDEGRRLAEKLVTEEDRVGDRDAWKSKDGDVVWEIARGQWHGFDHSEYWNRKREGVRKKTKDDMYARIARWLNEKVFEVK